MAGFKSKEEVPQPVIDELEQYYREVDWRYFNMAKEELGPALHREMKSKKTDYKVEYDDYGAHEVLDTDTFESKMVYSNSMEGFIVRGKWDEDNSIAYPWLISTSGRVINPPRKDDNNGTT